MREPTNDQKNVLGNLSRVRVVRATPGSGKTWLVAEVIRQELEGWSQKTSGIAALSFTRVGGDEIRKAVGHELGHPHFVGTIDAFLFRYVVRPFLQKCYPDYATPRLIPSEWGAQYWNRYAKDRKATPDKGRGINLFGCVFIDEKNGKAVVAYKPHPTLPLQRMDEWLGSYIKDEKLKIWRNSGYLTHSDASLWASILLGHPTYGNVIRTEIIRRFPFIIVDELQDTGYFLGKSVRLLLNEPSVRGLLVGDPDQAIFEFTGARPDLFNDFESIPGSEKLSLSNSLRCPPSVASVASHLKDTEGIVGPNPKKTGRTLLLRYDDMSADILPMIAKIKTEHPDQIIKVIARQTAVVEVLSGRNTKKENSPKLGCPPLNHIQRAVINFCQGRHVRALANIQAAIDLIVFDHEGVDDAKLEEYGIDAVSWRRLAIGCLLKAVVEPKVGSLYEWQIRLGEVLDRAINEFGLNQALQFTTGRLKPRKNKGWDTSCVDYIPQNIALITHTDGLAQTVHAVKGETHDITIFVWPDAKRSSSCPSTIWWSTDEKHRETKRIAYVAMTRSQSNLLVCVSNTCYTRLCATQKSFVDSFECMTVDDFMATLN